MSDRRLRSLLLLLGRNQKFPFFALKLEEYAAMILRRDPKGNLCPALGMILRCAGVSSAFISSSAPTSIGLDTVLLNSIWLPPCPPYGGQFLRIMLLITVPTEDAEGKLVLAPNSKVQFPMLNTPDGAKFFMDKKMAFRQGNPFPA